MATAPKFGSSGVTTRRRTRTGESLIHRDGFEKTQYFLRESGNVSVTQETITAWGIQGSGVNPLSRPLESAVLTESEEVVLHDDWTGVQPATGTNPTKLIGNDAMLIVSAERRLSISGEGILPAGFEPDQVGSGGISLTIQSAIGAATVSITNGFFMSLNDDTSRTDFTRWTIELMEYISPVEGEDGSRHLITVTVPDDITATRYTLSKTTSLGREAWATTETTVEEHFSTTAAGNWPTE